ncbi:fructose-6-phosphate aldolase [Deltaproteobacteria bacterium Smac51]|nr:fructose-6-phosphate aldolase [Deltaproteobacteria bacterium Smac51]
MKFFIDTANIEEIREAASYGFLDGVTTNPSLMAKEGVSHQDEHIKTICGITPGPVSAEVLATESKAMIEEGRHLASLAANVVVKLPLTMDGLKATSVLAAEGIKVNQTLVFSPLQAILAAKAGAAYVSPFVGRLDDVGHDGMDLIEEIMAIFTNYGFETEIIVASIRSPQHVLKSALIGADIATIPFKVIQQLASHPLTDKGVAAFLADHAKVTGK